MYGGRSGISPRLPLMSGQIGIVCLSVREAGAPGWTLETVPQEGQAGWEVDSPHCPIILHEMFQHATRARVRKRWNV